MAAAGGLQPGPPPAAELTRFQYTEVHMGMQARIVLYAPSEPVARAGAAAAFRRIGELDAIMSDYRQDSELRRLCDRAGGGPVRVSRDLFRVLQRAQEIAKWSDGAFDVTCGPLIALWRQARRDGRLPSQEAVTAAKALVGFRNLRLHPRRQAVELLKPGLRLDLGGIAKGYACDAAVAMLRARRLSRCMVDMGGDIVLGDAPPGRAGWEIENLNAERDEDRILTLSRCGVSTSGDIEQFVEIDGVRYSHIVDPRTGLGVTSRLAATVVAPKGELSDPLATAVCVLGPDAGRRLAARYPGTRVFIRRAE